MDPEISIIIPTYNRADLVGETIQSVLDQTFNSYEIVVVDDGSSDNTREVLDDMIRSEHIRYVFQENSGRSEARNNGLMNSSSNFLMFLDSDDILAPNCLELLRSAALSYPNSGLVAGKRVFIDKLGNEIDVIDPISITEGIFDKRIPFKKIRQLFFPPSTYIVKRDLALAVNGYDKEMEPAEDFDFFIKCCDLSPITVLDKTVVRMRRHDGNTSDIALREVSIRIGKKNLERLRTSPFTDEFVQLSQLKSEWCARVGDDSYALDRNLDALMYYLRTVAYSPGALFKGRLFRQIIASVIPKFVKQPVRTLVRRKRK